jgi:hypothetical protein
MQEARAFRATVASKALALFSLKNKIFVKQPNPPKEHQNPPERTIYNSIKSVMKKAASLLCRKRGRSEPPPPAKLWRHFY